MTLLFLIVLWMASAWLTYVIIRRDQVATFGKWKRIDRLTTLMMSLAGGPVLLAMTGCVAGIMKLAATPWANQEVKW
jgi:hypothetical protein